MSLLTLDQTTLFYWNLSHTYLKEQAGGIRDISSWTADVIPGLKPPTVNRSGTTPSLTTSKSRTATRPPSSVASRASVFTNIVRVSGTAEDSTHEKGALSDCDKTVGEEFEAKKCSPIKDGVRLSSNVSQMGSVMTAKCSHHV